MYYYKGRVTRNEHFIYMYKYKLKCLLHKNNGKDTFGQFWGLDPWIIVILQDLMVKPIVTSKVGHDVDVGRQSFDCSEARAVQLLHGWMFSWLIETKKQIQTSLSRTRKARWGWYMLICRNCLEIVACADFCCRNVLVQALLYDWFWLSLMHLA